MALSVRLRPHIRSLFTASAFSSTEFQTLLASQKRPEEIHGSTQAFDMFELNARLKQLVKTGRLDQARKMFDEMPQRDEVSWANLISGYVNSDTSEAYEALRLFTKMLVNPELRLDQFVLSLAVKACGLSLSLDFGESLHGCSIKSGLVNSVFVGSSLIDMYAKMGKIARSCRVFRDMPLRNVVSWTAVITGLVHGGFYREGLLYFAEMWRSNVNCDAYAYAIALKGCADSGGVNQGKAIHTQVLKRGLSDSSFVANSLATMYNKCGKFDYGLHLFAKMKIRDVVSWTAMITTFVQMGQEKHAVEVFRRMRESGVSPNGFTFAAIVSGCANLGRVEWGEQLHGHVLRLGLADYLSVANSVVTLYSKCGRLASASAMFDGMGRRDIVSWSTIIAGYSQVGYGEEAFEYLSWMGRDGPKPNEFAFASLLSACGSMSILEQGKQLHARVVCVGLDQTSLVQSSLINMYSKCGSIREASIVFESIEKDDIVSWTAMIGGYAEHGFSQQAIGLFEKIPEVGLRPDEVTFVGVLTACSHVGLVDLGLKYFNLMLSEYRINPTKQHYGCVIDLLCRAGRLDDAEEMIKTMPFQQDDIVWSALLRACRIHSEVERGRRAAEEILKLIPNCAGTHVTLANIYAAEGNWKEASELRKVLKLKGMSKEPGWSWIKVKDKISAFVAGDRAHPHCESICSVLKLMVSKMESSAEEMISELIGVED